MDKIDLLMALDTLAGAYAKKEKQEDGSIRYVLEEPYQTAYNQLKNFINEEEQNEQTI